MPYSSKKLPGTLRLADLAHELGLSQSTVSRALSGHSEISIATANRVLSLAEKLGYQPNVAAASLRTGWSQTLGVIVPHLHNNFFPRILTGIEEAASEAGYRLLICQSNEDTERERQSIATLLHAQVAGILVSVARTTQDMSAFELVRRRKIPLVFFDRFVADTNVSAVVIDDQAGGYQATRHLLAQGYQRIAHLAGPQHLSIYRNRRLGYEQALREVGQEISAELVISSDLHVADGVALTRQLLALPQPPDAIFSASDFAALGCLQELLAQGRRVPTDYGLIGFSDEFFSQHTTPSLSTISQHCEVLGRSAAQLLLQLRRASKPGPARHIKLQPTLLARTSSSRFPEC